MEGRLATHEIRDNAILACSSNVYFSTISTIMNAVTKDNKTNNASSIYNTDTASHEKLKVV